MADDVAQTLEEAIRRGYRKLPPIEARTAAARFGAAIMKGNCATLPPGAICAEYACVNGVKLVMYCDGAKGCTEHYEAPC